MRAQIRSHSTSGHPLFNWQNPHRAKIWTSIGAGRGSSELFEQRFCLSQIERVEAFSKPAEDRNQQFASLL